MEKINTSFNLNKKLYQYMREEVLDEQNLSMTEFITRCMLLSVEDDNFLNSVNDKYWDHARKLESKYK